jgi:hypothetical protein
MDKAAPFTFLPRSSAEGAGGGVECSIVLMTYGNSSRSRLYVLDRATALLNTPASFEGDMAQRDASSRA